MSIHARIKEARLAKKLSYMKLAEKIGVSSWQTIQQWEREDGTAPRRNRMAALAEALGVTEEWIERGTVEIEDVPRPDGTTLVALTGNEELQLELYRSMTPDQQRELLEAMRQVTAANLVTQKIIGKKFKTTSNRRVEETFGMPGAVKKPS